MDNGTPVADPVPSTSHVAAAFKSVKLWSILHKSNFGELIYKSFIGKGLLANR